MMHLTKALPSFSFLSIVISICITAGSFFIYYGIQDTDAQVIPRNETRAIDLINSTNYSSKSKSVENSGTADRQFGNPIDLSNNTGHSELPRVYVNKNYVYVMWIDDSSANRDIYFKRSTDNGFSFNRTINLSNNTGGSLDPRMSFSGSNVYVIWEHTPGNNGEIFFARSTDYGANFSKSANIGNNSGFIGLPEIATSKNSVFVVWHDASNGVIFRRSTDNGTSFEAPVRLSKNILAFDPHIATVLGTSNVYVVWLTPSNSNQSATYNINFRRSVDNGATFDEAVTLSRKDILAFDPHIVTQEGNNNVHIVWHNGSIVRYSKEQVLISDVVYARSTDNGATFGNSTILSNYTGWSTNPQIAVSEGNDVYVVWQSNPQGRSGEITLRRSTDNGATFQNAIVLSNETSNESHPQIAVSEGNNVYVVWSDNATGNIETNFVDNAHYLPQQNKNEAKEFENNKSTHGRSPSANIAVVEPTFTKAAYDKSFYIFYNLKKNLLGLPHENNITRYTNMLHSNMSHLQSKKQIESHECPCDLLVKHLKWLNPQFNISVLGDVNVHTYSDMFTENGTNKYDVIILVHQEYVTQDEYNNLKSFVSNGGTLILFDGNVFYAEVKYDQKANTLSLVKGHGWAYNGISAWKSVFERWANETSQWVGSNYLCCYGDTVNFANNPFNYTHNEEQYITNPSARILLDYNSTLMKYRNGTTHVSNPKITTYEFDYKKGKVIGLGLYSDDILWSNNDRFLRFFDSLLFKYATVR